MSGCSNLKDISVQIVPRGMHVVKCSIFIEDIVSCGRGVYAVTFLDNKYRNGSSLL